MIKYIGIILISSGVFIYGKTKSHELTYAKNISLELLDLLNFIQRELTYGGVSKEKILRRFPGKVLNECGFIQDICLGEQVSKAVSRHLGMLDKSETEMLIEFFEEFGKSSSCQKEAEKCKSFAQKYEQAANHACTVRQNKALLYGKLGIICALMTALILI